MKKAMLFVVAFTLLISLLFLIDSAYYFVDSFYYLFILWNKALKLNLQDLI